MVTIDGHVDEGFGAIADAFVENFEQRGEVGAAFCLYVDGRVRADVRAGVADATTGRRWREDTLQLVFSSTKGITAICIAQLVDRGLLDYDDLVADHWPEFGAAGKDAVTVGQLLSHQAGLIDLQPPLPLDDIVRVERVVATLQDQTPEWPPGSAHGYHAITFGWLAGELLARVDGRRIGRFVTEEIATPLGAEFWIGLPESEEPRVARLETPGPPTDPVLMERFGRMYRKDAYGYRSITLDGRLRTIPQNHFDTRDVHAAEMPAANGITTARSLARIYAATIGEVDGVRLLSKEATDGARTERASGEDLTLLQHSRFGAGFWLHDESAPMIQDGSFGHPGMGGSLGYANPELGIGYGYVMNQMGSHVTGDPRTIALNDAVLACL